MAFYNYCAVEKCGSRGIFAYRKEQNRKRSPKYLRTVYTTHSVKMRSVVNKRDLSSVKQHLFSEIT
jgi:hypothetical protein